MIYFHSEFLHTLLEVESRNPLYVKCDNSLSEKEILENLISLEINLSDLMDCKPSLTPSLKDCHSACKYLISCYSTGREMSRTILCTFLYYYRNVLEFFEEAEQIIICLLQTEHWDEEQFVLMEEYLNQIGLYLNDSNTRV